MLQFIILTQRRNSEAIPEYSEEHELKPVDGRWMCNTMILPNHLCPLYSEYSSFWKGKKGKEVHPLLGIYNVHVKFSFRCKE